MLRKIRHFFIRRSFTNFVSYLIDNLLPPVIRDNRYLMFPFYYLSFKGKNIKEFMNFKAGFYRVNDEKLEQIYQNYNTIGTERRTDLNQRSVRYMMKNLHPESKTILDAGCGKGYLLKELKKSGYQVTGADIFDDPGNFEFSYIKASVQSLPFPDESFDIVISTHTLEHIIDIKKAVTELKRVAGKQIMVVVPCQRFYYYTLDHHLHFFPRKEMLEGLMDIQEHSVKKIGGDWIYIGYLGD